MLVAHDQVPTRLTTAKAVCFIHCFLLSVLVVQPSQLAKLLSLLLHFLFQPQHVDLCSHCEALGLVCCELGEVIHQDRSQSQVLAFSSSCQQFVADFDDGRAVFGDRTLGSGIF